MSVNKAILLGRLGADPELKYTESGKAVANFSLATSEKWTDSSGEKQESTTWHNVTVWNKLAETIKEYVTKGQEIYLEGSIKNSKYTDKDGVEKYKSEIILQRFSFVGSKADSTGGSDDLPY